MKRKSLTRFVVLLACSLASTALYADDENEISFEVLRHGNLSGVDHQMIMVAETAMQFEHLWNMHSMGVPAPEPVPKVDFEKEVVIGQFLGNSASCGYNIRFTDVEDKHLSVQVKSTITVPTSEIQCLIAEQPYEFIVVPRQAKLFSFKQSVNKNRSGRH